MKTIMLDHTKCSAPRSVGKNGGLIIQDYDTPFGIVREFGFRSRPPKYRLLSTREPVQVKFYQSFDPEEIE